MATSFTTLFQQLEPGQSGPPQQLVWNDIEKLTTLRERLNEYLKQEGGDIILSVGKDEHLSAEDADDFKNRLQTLTEGTDVKVTVLRKKTAPAANNGVILEILVRRKPHDLDFAEVRVAVVGNVDAGKSTLLGVLTHGVLDDGRGKSRTKLFRHKHEIDSGRTSSVGNDILGFDCEGTIVNEPNQHSGALDWAAICKKASKVLTFIDLAGHERYLKTTVFGLTGHHPDYVMLMVGANAGLVGMTKEHLGLSLALSVPVYVVVTKIDMCPSNVLDSTLKLLKKVLKSPGVRKLPLMINTIDDVITAACNFGSERICPIFQISNVTGENIDLLKVFLNLLKSRGTWVSDGTSEFLIDDTYMVPGVGTVVSGTMMRGTLRPNETVLFGPDALGKYESVTLKSIHRKRLPVNYVEAGHTASIALKKVKKAQLRKGMVLVGKTLEMPAAVREFQVELLILHHPTTISCKYQAMVHCGSVRQTATLIKMDKEHLRTGDRAHVTMRFLKKPEYIKVGDALVFREGRTKAVGKIVAIEDNHMNEHMLKMKDKRVLPTRTQQSGGTSTSNSETVCAG
eukprot:Clim_evm33s143 gene=Clim_evmTU33s143